MPNISGINMCAFYFRWLVIFIGALGSLSCNVGLNGSSNQVVAGPGASAHDYLAATTYTKLSIEIQAVSGYSPSPTTQSQLVSFLQGLLNKPGGIQIIIDPALPSPGQTSFSVADVRQIEAANRLHYSSGSEIYAYFLFLDGSSTSDSGNSSILGQAYGPTSMVIYEKTLKGLAGGVGQPSLTVLEQTVLEHEFDHILGLVNTGTTLQTSHQDSPHGAHCNNTNCLMYYQVDTSNFIANLLGGTVPGLDANCLQDLKANGGK